MKNLIRFALALCAPPLFGYTSPLATYEDYVFTRPVNTNRITGKLMGPKGDYSAMRVEDVAFIYEAVQERNAIIAGSYSGFGVSNKFVKGLTSGSFPLSYTNLYPWAIHDGTRVVAYYDTNTVTNVTARLGIDTLWPQKLTLDCTGGWIDKDEKWPDAIEDADKQGTGDAAYTNLPTAWLTPTYVNPQATNTVTNLVKFVVWPLKDSVVEAYKFLAKTEKCVKGVARESGGSVNETTTTDYRGETGHWKVDYEADRAWVEGLSVSDMNFTSTNHWDGDLTVVSKQMTFSLDKVFMQVFDIRSSKAASPGEKTTISFSGGSSGTFEATWNYERKTEDAEIVLDLGISYVVATAGLNTAWGRIKTVDLYYLGGLTVGGLGDNYKRKSGFLERFGGHGGANPSALDGDFKDVHVVIPLLDQEKVLVPHTNRVWNAELGDYEVGDVQYTVGVRLTPSVDEWAEKAIKIAGKNSWSQWCNSLANEVEDPASDPETPPSYEYVVPPHEGISDGWVGWDGAEAGSYGLLTAVFQASPHRAVVTVDLTSKITDDTD